jgi:hypothetical protein
MQEKSKLPGPSPGVAPPQETLTDTDLHRGRPLFLTAVLALVAISSSVGRKILTSTVGKLVGPDSEEETKDRG